MTKRKGILDVEIDVKKLFGELPISRSTAPKIEKEQPKVSNKSSFNYKSIRHNYKANEGN